MRELVGDPDRAPVRVGVSIGDSIAGIYAAFGTVMALFQREAKRNAAQPAVALQQRIIDVALNESILSVMESLVPDYLAYGVKRERVGGRMEGIAPSNAYPCNDGTSIIIAGNGDAIYGRYMQISAVQIWRSTPICRPTRGDGCDATNWIAIGRVDVAALPRRGARVARRGRGTVGADLHRCRHLHRRTVRRAKHDPGLHR